MPEDRKLRREASTYRDVPTSEANPNLVKHGLSPSEGNCGNAVACQKIVPIALWLQFCPNILHVQASCMQNYLQSSLFCIYDSMEALCSCEKKKYSFLEEIAFDPRDELLQSSFSIFARLRNL
jgi:hypothetical protein